MGKLLIMFENFLFSIFFRLLQFFNFMVDVFYLTLDYKSPRKPAYFLAFVTES
jgi:hypothetical protein